MKKTGLIAKISIKYVLPTCIWKYFWRILRYFAFFWEFRGISRKDLNFAGPRPREISEALFIARQWPENHSTSFKTRFLAKSPGANGLKGCYIMYRIRCNTTHLDYFSGLLTFAITPCPHNWSSLYGEKHYLLTWHGRLLKMRMIMSLAIDESWQTSSITFEFLFTSIVNPQK